MTEVREVLFLANALFAFAAVPLVMARVAPNRFYGFRTPRTLADRGLWYRVNGFAGRALLAAAAVGLAIVAELPDASFAAPSPTAIVAMLLPIVAAIAASFIYLRRQR